VSGSEYGSENMTEVSMITKENSDPWKHRSEGMQCKTCMWYVKKGELQPVSWKDADECGFDAKRKTKVIGRCRRHAPTMNGYPVVFDNDWCGDHKLDENKVVV
jgi:hypothetical protein